MTKKKRFFNYHIVNFQAPCVEKERDCLYPQMIHLFCNSQYNDNNEAQRTVNFEHCMCSLSLFFLPSINYLPAKISEVLHWSALCNRTFQPRGRSSCCLLCWLTVFEITCKLHLIRCKPCPLRVNEWKERSKRGCSINLDSLYTEYLHHTHTHTCTRPNTLCML